MHELRVKCSSCSWEEMTDAEAWQVLNRESCPNCNALIYIYPVEASLTTGGVRKVPEDEWKPEAIEGEREKREEINRQKNERLAKEALADRSIELLEALRALAEMEQWFRDDDHDPAYALENCSLIRKILLGGER